MGRSEQRNRVGLTDGRSLEYVEAGASDGRAVVYHHGSPGSAVLSPEQRAAAGSRGLRLVAASRSGYAGSSRDAGRDVAAAAADTAALCDALGIASFATLGWSGGGPHAIACAALLEGRCVAAVSLAGVAPYVPGSFDWTEGMAETNVAEFAQALEGGPAYDAALEASRQSILALDPASLHTVRDVFGDLVSDADVAATSLDDARLVLGSMVDGLREGVGGWRDDDQAFLLPWGFDVAAVRVPVAIWYGDEDLMVPSSHGDWLAANVAGARSRRLAGDGHLSVGLGRFGEALDELVALAGGPW